MRNLALVYEALPLGVFIQGVSGKLYTEDEWNSQETPNGIAVLTDNCSFVMALENAETDKIDWGTSGVLINNIVTTDNYDVAITDYNGESNTAEIKSQDETYHAAQVASGYQFPNGKWGYLGALGEWKAALDNKNAIQSALTKCGGTTISSSQYWSSTQYADSSAWYINWSSGYINGINKVNLSYNRAFCQN